VRNRILGIVRDSIPYVKELRSAAKSIAGAVLMQQLDYWFERAPNGFYKFMAKPESDVEGYREGDSWEEEIGINHDEFRSAFDNIGVRYKSKSDFDKSVDKFRGKFYCSYIDRVTRKTWYFRNHGLVDDFLDSICFRHEDKSKVKQCGGGDFRNVDVPISTDGKRQSVEMDIPISTDGKRQSLEMDIPISRDGKRQSLEMDIPISNLYTEINTEIKAKNKTERGTDINIEGDLYRDRCDSVCPPTQVLKFSKVGNSKIHDQDPSNEFRSEVSDLGPKAAGFAEKLDLISGKKGSAEKNKIPKKIKDSDYQVFLDLWNERAPGHWAKCQVLSKPRITALAAFTRDYGDSCLEVFDAALKYANSDQVWCMRPGTKLTLENFLSNGKPGQWAEKWEAVVNSPPPMSDQQFEQAKRFARNSVAFEEAFAIVNGRG